MNLNHQQSREKRLSIVLCCLYHTIALIGFTLTKKNLHNDETLETFILAHAPQTTSLEFKLISRHMTNLNVT